MSDGDEVNRLVEQRAQALCVGMAEVFDKKYKELLEKVTKKTEVPVPTLKSKGLQVQARLNCEILSTLLPLKDHDDPEVKKTVEEVSKKLEQRNTDLQIADISPEGFRGVDRLQAMRALSTDGSSEAAKLLALSTLVNPSIDKKRRIDDDTPFRQRGAVAGSTAPRFAPFAKFGGGQSREHRRQSSSQQSRCFNCHSTSHWASQCPQGRR